MMRTRGLLSFSEMALLDEAEAPGYVGVGNAPDPG